MDNVDIKKSNMNNSWPHLFGIRHLSPGGAWHLRSLLNEINPTAVLIEGLSDANSQIEHLTSDETVPPVAILAYTEELPIRTILYPIASYSPEYQALLWARENNAHAEFIDLPSEVFLAFEYEVTKEEARGEEKSIYDRWAEIAGEDNHETYWERNFEHNLNKDSYRNSIYEYSRSIRELEESGTEAGSSKEHAENLIREAFMRRKIKEAMEAGHRPERIVVITGAYHSSALSPGLKPLTDEELDRLPKRKSKLTLMPYSYFKLSSQSGYGAGNRAPQYFEMMWGCIKNEDFSRLPGYYFSSLAANLREKGTYRSTADVIEAVRLSNTLAALKGGNAPTLEDLRDAAATCLGHGDFSVIAEAAARVEIGTVIGNLPEGVSQTPVQEDFNRELKRLKLEKYKSTVAQDLELDLRENRRVKSEEAAFLDLNRSFFLNRLRVLGISFAREKGENRRLANWAENWVLKWSPEAEIEMVESALKGETIELACAFAFKERLEGAKGIDETAGIIRTACECGMMESMEEARRVLQGMAVDSGDFAEIAEASRELSMVISYGDIRKFSPEPLIPLLQQLFLRGTLILLDASSCSNDAAVKVLEAVNDMNIIASEHYDKIDAELWLQRLAELSDRDDKNSRLSGYACSILIEKNLIDNEKLSHEVSRRLSPGIDADLGAGWFEGLSMRNRYALLSRRVLWEQLEEYVSSLEDNEFQRALVFLRRAFGGFSPSEKNRIAEILGDVWNVDAEETSDYLNQPLNKDEQEKIDDLNDFDFGDI